MLKINLYIKNSNFSEIKFSGFLEYLKTHMSNNYRDIEFNIYCGVMELWHQSEHPFAVHIEYNLESREAKEVCHRIEHEISHCSLSEIMSKVISDLHLAYVSYFDN